MYRIRFHGRGGQGMKTASRILGKAFFLQGFEVQDAPRYGAERRGAPIFAYVRANHRTINERGIISRPDLVVVADNSLMAMPVAGVLQGCNEITVLLLPSGEEAETWQQRLNLPGPLFTLPQLGEEEKNMIGAACVGGAAALIGVISLESLEEAVRQELGTLDAELIEVNLAIARKNFTALSVNAGVVAEGESVPVQSYTPPAWIELPFEDARLASPAIHAAATSENVNTGLWRTVCPVIDEERCNRCWWICSTFCPEGAIIVDEKRQPHIDYKHCKGCLVCLAQCPTHAIEARPEKEMTVSGGKGR